MNEEQLLQELAKVARDDSDRLDSRWDSLAADELSEAEAAKLRDEAASSEKGRVAWEAFRPLGDSFQAGAVAEILRRQGASAGQSSADTEVAPGKDTETGTAAEVRTPHGPVEAHEAPQGRLLAFPRRWLGGLAAAAVAASLLFVLRPAAPPLPAYSLDFTGGTKVVRSQDIASEDIPILETGGRFELILRPETDAEGKVAARAFLVRDSQAESPEIRPWPGPPPEVAESGAARLVGILGEGLTGDGVELPEGSWEIWLLAGRRSDLPNAEALSETLRSGDLGNTSPPWRWGRQAVRVLR